MYKDKAWLKRVSDDYNKKEDSTEGKSTSDLFKGVVNSLVKDALKVLEEIEVEWEFDHNSRELREKYYLLRHYLDYLRRFCEGKV
jgi:hypothetical protein